MLLNEQVEFPLADRKGALAATVLGQWRQQLAVQMIPYHQILAALGATVEGSEITEVSEAWCKYPVPEPALYLREWQAALGSICQLIEAVATENRTCLVPDTSFHAPGFLQDIDHHRYNPREDTMLNSQRVQFPHAEGSEHQYVVEKR